MRQGIPNSRSRSRQIFHRQRSVHLYRVMSNPSSADVCIAVLALRCDPTGWLRLHKSSRLSLAPRALAELGGWLKETFNDQDQDDDDATPQRIIDCNACREIVTAEKARTGEAARIDLLIVTQAIFEPFQGREGGFAVIETNTIADTSSRQR